MLLEFVKHFVSHSKLAFQNSVFLKNGNAIPLTMAEFSDKAVQTDVS